MIKNKNDRIVTGVFYVIVTLLALACLYPLLLTISVSFSDEKTVAEYGFQLIPKKFSLYTYQYFLSSNGFKILNSYAVTLFVVAVGTICSVITTVSYAYVASLKKFKLANFFSFFAYFTMLFSGGMLPWYILCTRYYHLTNKLYALILPYLMNVFFMYLMRNYFMTIPEEMREAALVDGAGQFTIFFRIMLPLAKVGLVTIIMFYVLMYWNDWYLALMLIEDQKLFPVQYLLYNMLQNAQYLSNNAAMSQHAVVPSLTSRMAMTCISIGPILFVYPFVQRYFVKGVTLGAVKG